MSLESAVANTMSGLQNFETKSKINYQLAAKQLDVMREQGEMITEMIDAANVSGKVPGAGGKLDVRG